MARRNLVLLALAGLGFASLGLPDGVIGVAWPSMRASFDLPLDALGALLVSSTIGYVASSFSAGWLLSRMGVGTLLALSCLATGASLVGYATAPEWSALVALGLLAGLGAGAIDASINTWAANSQSARTLSLLHACYGLGTTAGPAIMTRVLMAGHAWRRGYWILGATQIALALAFSATLRLWRTPGEPREGHPAAHARAPLAATLRLPAAWLGIACFFLYVGLEAIAGAWTFSLLAARGAGMASAGSAVSAWWGGLFVGRVGLALLPPATLHTRLRGCASGLVLAAAWLALDLGHTQDLLAVALLGLAAGPIFPSLISATPARLTPAHAANAVGLQVAAAALGQSLLPAAIGVGAAAVGLELVPGALLACAVLLLAANERLERSAPAPGLSAAARAS